jgi:hypothetical protein
MTLYNLKTDGDEYRITKFTNDLEVESSYLTSHQECTCPAGHRPTCRHRQMLPSMLAADLADSGGFYDFESQQVLVPLAEESNEDFEVIADANRPTFTEGTIGITPKELAAEMPTYEVAAGIANETNNIPIKEVESLPEPQRGLTSPTFEELAAIEEQQDFATMLRNEAEAEADIHPTLGKIERRF